MTAEFKVVIPARYGSSRFPGKVLADINGKPMIQHVYERALASGAQQVLLATDEQRVAAAAQAFGADVCMTSAEHLSGSDRIAEVVETYQWADETIVVNVQGDEPYIPPQNIAQVAEDLAATDEAVMSTLVTPFSSDSELQDSNNVKVVGDRNGFALYFSRAVIPYQRDAEGSAHYQRHVGLYAYRAGFLKQFVKLAPAPLELTEKLEQLRVLWHGDKIHLAKAVCKPPAGVDTPEDLLELLKITP